MVARAVGAKYHRRGSASGGIVYGYFPGLARDRYHWAYRPGVAAGVVPTGDGLACVWAGTAAGRFDRSERLETTFRQLLAEAMREVARWIAAASPAGPLRGFPGTPGFMRSCGGPGWALVGDAGYYKDPVTAHGLTDALRDAELLVRAVLERHAADGPNSMPSSATSTPATRCRRHCSMSPNGSPATGGTSSSCGAT